MKDISIITSVQNTKVKFMRELKTAKARRAEGLMPIEGVKLITEAAVAGLMPQLVLFDPERVDASLLPPDALPVAPHVLEAVSDTQTPQGAVAAVPIPRALDIDALLTSGGHKFVVLDGLQDPGNVGTIWRTADAAGFDGVILSEDCPDPFSPKVLRSSMGSAFRVGVRRTDIAALLERMRKTGYNVVSSQLDGEPFFEKRPREGGVALVIGNEARGVSERVQALATHSLKLPMLGGAESLNAAVAAGIMMYAWAADAAFADALND